MSATPCKIQVARFRDGTWQQITDTVTMETPLDVSWVHTSEPAVSSASGTETADSIACDPEAHCALPDRAPGRVRTTTLWAWPHDLAPLALGQVLLDKAPSPHCLHRVANVEETGERAFHVTIGDALPDSLPAAPAVWKAEDLLLAMHSFISAGGLWDDTGCFHRAGIFDVAKGELLTRAEDIGRHNCVDRLAGWSVLQGIPLSDKALLISARMTSSLCAKALRAGFRIIVSRSAVTTAAMGMAREANATLVGFARTDESRFTVFADGPGRIHTTVAKC